jgi:hypothetical protein
LLVRIRAYRGRSILLEDGTELARGDLVLEIHLNNEHLVHLHEEANSEVRLAKRLVREIRGVLAEAAVYLEHPEREAVKALYGISMIHRGVQALGFRTVAMRRGAFYYATTWYLRLLLAFLHPLGRSRLAERADQLVPKQVVMSRRELLARYGKKD